MKQLMTLSQWEKLADRTAFVFVKKTMSGGDMRYIPDTVRLQDSGVRSLLWQLTDYLVSSVTGGTIWLIKRGN